ncbi:hypothetical protein CLV98_11432 [Dyadobacter jejuensis]|uniref:DUF5672 domain-containing protein n=2 Tax=Dyadobacter jejuensis TaxID=1082580 RepID=A0A316AC23_9BACT|nr:hypothetical protein CLV98_11432 [Dyadobacter jejuensis]
MSQTESETKPSVVVVIPIYKVSLTETEKRSLRQCMRVLSAYPIRLLTPEGLPVGTILAEYPHLECITFEKTYFESIAGYNSLLTSADFYRAFSAYDFMLIYQLDAFVFEDRLAEWCAAGFDYIGAPSLHHPTYDALEETQAQDFAQALNSHRVVLNGGLSLRRISAMIRYLKIYALFYPVWRGNEDMLFSQEATRLLPMKVFLKTPKWKQALSFAFEKSPAASYSLTQRRLPFGCHAWERYDYAFWKPLMAASEAGL